MSNYSEQESDNELKLIGKVEVKIKPKGFDNNSKSIDQLSNAIAEEKSRLNELIVKVDANYEGLVKEINDIKSLLEPPPMDSPELLQKKVMTLLFSIIPHVALGYFIMVS